MTVVTCTVISSIRVGNAVVVDVGVALLVFLLSFSASLFSLLLFLLLLFLLSSGFDFGARLVPTRSHRHKAQQEPIVD